MEFNDENKKDLNYFFPADIGLSVSSGYFALKFFNNKFILQLSEHCYIC